MRLDKFTLKGQEAIETAVAMAESRGHQHVEPEHVLVALVEQAEGVTKPILGKIGANAQAIQSEAEAAIKASSFELAKGLASTAEKLANEITNR